MTTRAEEIAQEIAGAHFCYPRLGEEDITKEMLAEKWDCQVDTAGKRAEKLVKIGVLTRHRVIGLYDRPVYVYRKKNPSD